MAEPPKGEVLREGGNQAGGNLWAADGGPLLEELGWIGSLEATPRPGCALKVAPDRWERV